MTIERIFTRAAPGGPQTEHAAVRIVADSGIEGDRHFGRHDDPGQNISFIEAEEIEAFFGPRAKTFVGGPRQLAQALEGLAQCSAYRTRETPKVREFLAARK